MRKPTRTPYRYSDCKVDRIIDGDTCDLWINLGFSTFVKKRIRMWGINAPVFAQFEAVEVADPA